MLIQGPLKICARFLFKTTSQFLKLEFLHEISGAIRERLDVRPVPVDPRRPADGRVHLVLQRRTASGLGERDRDFDRLI